MGCLLFFFFLLWLQFLTCRMAPASAPVSHESHEGKNSEKESNQGRKRHLGWGHPVTHCFFWQLLPLLV